MTGRMNYTLWTVQALLAALFLFAGAVKLAMPADALAQQPPLPVWFLRFIGTVEVSGALGLILPGLLRIGEGLTPLAGGAGVVALMPFLAGTLAALVAWSRAPRFTLARPRIQMA